MHRPCKTEKARQQTGTAEQGRKKKGRQRWKEDQPKKANHVYIMGYYGNINSRAGEEVAEDLTREGGVVFNSKGKDRNAKRLLLFSSLSCTTLVTCLFSALASTALVGLLLQLTSALVGSCPSVK